ncbi:MAG: bifunctional 2-polyprenyl-6-hydroxyphenol methylase/3-demethylubiquinol 3-O-methyltransferase UbiG [Sphingomonas sp.]
MTFASTIDATEAAHFGALARDWWDPKGSSAMLHRLNPARLAYLRAAIDAHWGGDAAGFAPLAGRTALDIGCGAGLLTEPLARLGARVTGVDAAPENIGAAQAHAGASGLEIEYLAGGVEAVAERRFDLVVSMEVIEHVANTRAFAAGARRRARRGRADGAFHPQSHVALAPRDDHDRRRLRRDFPRGRTTGAGSSRPTSSPSCSPARALRVTEVRGLGFSPARGFVLGDDTGLDYLVTAVRA